MARPQAAIAKISPPRLPEILPRPRLFELLDRATTRPVIWITAPAGAGKTTLVAGWFAARRLPCLWYQVDREDADPATFFYYLGLAARKATPARRKPLPLLAPEYRGDIPLFSRRFFESLFSRLVPPAVVVFDNFQEAPAGSGFHAALPAGLETIPEGVNLVVVSREPPPAAYARLLANQRIALLDWHDLRFTPDETAALIRARGKGDFSPEFTARLQARTEGWVAGIVLMLEAARLHGRDDHARDRAAPRQIFDYFASEIFDKTDHETSDFLLKTALLAQMTPAIAKALTGSEEAAAILSRLCRACFFTTRLAGREDLYQYHPLFREFLLARAAGLLSRDEIDRLRRRAGGLLEAAGQVESAAALFRKAGSWDEFGRLIGRQAPGLFAQGRAEVVRLWLEDLPDAVLETSPYLLYWQGACTMPYSPVESRRKFERAFEIFRDRDDRLGMLLAWSGAADTSLHEAEFRQLDHWLALFEGLRAADIAFPSPEIEARITLSVFNAMALRQPDHPGIEKWRERAFALALASRDLDMNLRLQAGVYLTVHLLWLGDFGRATVLIDFLKVHVRSREVSDLVLLMVRTAEALYCFHRGLHLRNREVVFEALETATEKGVHVWDGQLIDLGLSSALSEGDLSTVEELLGKMREGLDKSRRFDVAHYHVVMAWKYMLLADYTAAHGHMKTALHLMNAVGFRAAIAASTIGMVEVLRELGEFGKAHDYLAGVYETARSMKSAILKFMCLVADTLLAFDQGLEETGLDFLGRAMALGREQDYVNMFFWRPAVMAGLCVKALEAGVEAGYVRGLIRRRNLVPEHPPVHLEEWPFPLGVRTLGSFEVYRDDEPLIFTGKVQRRPLELLKALIVFGGSEVPERRLTDALWPEADGDAAHSAFTTTLARLRDLLGVEGAVTVREGRVSLDRRRCRIDCQAFDRAAEFFEEGCRQGEKPEELQSRAEKALRIHAGPFLPADEPLAWTAPYRERLRGRFRRLAERAGDLLEKAGRREEAMHLYRQALETDELAEGLYRRLVRCCDQAGSHSEALEACQFCRVVFKAHGLDLSPETEKLFREITGSRP